MASSHPPSRATSLIASLLSFSTQQLDRIVPPETRLRFYSRTADFAVRRPLVFSFISSQLLLALIPLLLFASFAVSTLVFSFGAALIFTLFWAGVASLVLVPTLCVTGGLALLVWTWAITVYVSGNWLLKVFGSSSSGSKASTTSNSSHDEIESNVDGGDVDVDNKKGYKHLGTWPAGLSDEQLKDFAGVNMTKDKKDYPTKPTTNGYHHGHENGNGKGDGAVKTDNKFDVLSVE
ncbi:hypothetical protein QBC43DRAFT_49199 [Cladorrhinum sp. PSN259]|nr:hypothetical protein QBC43DRAFT_49199 [Cladorrhinum sp. PSN259]